MIENRTYSGSFEIELTKESAPALEALGVPVLWVNGEPYFVS